MAKLIIVRGAPGAGKSTFAKMAFPGTLLLENDQCLIEDGVYKWSPERVKKAIDWCMMATRNALERKMDVVVANTFTKMRYVMTYSKIAEECNADFEVWRCNGNFENVHGLSDEMVRKFKDSMEDWPGEKMANPV